MNDMTQPGKWTCIEIPCDSQVAEDLAAFIADSFGVGVEITDHAIRFYLDTGGLSENWESKLRGILALPFGMASVGVSYKYSHYELPEVNWTDRWKEHFKPLRVGKRFVVRPTWEAFEPSPLDRVILMDPGRAFGTGHHESTRLCLEWLEDWTASRADHGFLSLLDVGTGSGILAIAAALLGFQTVVGVDNDSEAIEVARENLYLNGVADRIHLLDGTVTDVEGRFDCILANIHAGPLIHMRVDLAGRLAPAGVLSVSGILLEQVDEVRYAYVTNGLKHIHTRTAGEWALLVFGRSGRIVNI